MSYLIYIVSFLIALFGLLFKTTIEDKDTGKKHLNSYGWVVLTLMITAVIFNIYINYRNSVQAALETKNLTLTKEKESLKQEFKSRTDAERWNTQKEITNSILAETNRSVDNLKSQNALLKTNVSLQKTIALQAERNNFDLKARLGNAQQDLIKLKYPINNLYMSVSMNIELEDTLADRMKTFIDTTTNKHLMLSLTSILSEFPELKEYIQHLLFRVDFYRNNDLTEYNSTHTVTYFFDLETILRTDFLSEQGEIVPSLNGTLLLFNFSNLKTADFSNSTDFESLDELCNRMVIISVIHRGKSSSVADKVTFYKLALSPKKEADDFSMGFMFDPTEKQEISHFNFYDNLITYRLDDYDCLITPESIRRKWFEPVGDPGFFPEIKDYGKQKKSSVKKKNLHKF